MPSNSCPLNIFTQPIPICQPEADLGSMLKIFQRSPCRLLAIPQSQGNWGIIHSEDLLSLMARAWLGETTVVSHPKNLAYRSNIPRISIQDFDGEGRSGLPTMPNRHVDSIIVPATVYHADTELEEFLGDLQYDWFSSREEHLVVSSTGKLLGRLDRHKILEYLVLKWAIDFDKITSQPAFPATKTTNTLLATLAHELKSPLTGIVGLTNLLGAKKLGELNQRQSGYVSLIHRSGQKMVSIIDDLLALTALTSEQLPSELINLEFLCRQVYQQVITKIQSRGTAEFDSNVLASEPKLTIVGSDLAIANKPILSRILFHLMLETFSTGKYPDRLEVKIAPLQELTTIEIKANLDERAASLASEKTEFSSLTSDLDSAIALYLAETIDATVNRVCWGEGCQFTLLLPKATVPPNKSSQSLRATSAEEELTTTKNLTILYLCPEPEAIDLQASPNRSTSFDLKRWSDSEQQVGSQHRIIEADSLEQAHTLARIWELDVVILDGDRIIEPIVYLRSLQESEYLAALPLITLDARTTEAANQIEGLSVYPCLLPAEHRSIEDLMQVIQIATEA